MLATVGAIVLGYFANFVRDMFNGNKWKAVALANRLCG